MSTGKISVYYGEGYGKSNSAYGRALKAASEGEEVIVICFLKGTMNKMTDFLKRLEPEIKIFQFEKTEDRYEDLDGEARKDAERNIINGVNFARKVLATGGSNLVILDEFVGLLDTGVIDKETFVDLLKNKQDDTDLVMTGRNFDESLWEYADEVYRIQAEK